MRGQVELPAVAVALLVLTGTVVFGVVVADGAFRSAERPALEQRTAAGLSDRLVGESSALTVRQNVLDSADLDDLDGAVLYRSGLPEDGDATVLVDGETVVSTGDIEGGTRVERIVVLEKRTERTLEPELGRSRAVVLPRRTANATLTIEPSNATVETVDVNGRVVLHDESGVEGAYDVDIPPYETATLGFEADGNLSGVVTIDYYPPETQKTTLTVIVDA
jgi:hypothetical protein